MPSVHDTPESRARKCLDGRGTLHAKREEVIAKILSTFAKLGHFVTLAPGYYGRPARRAG
jgi:hypothetical protein